MTEHHASPSSRRRRTCVTTWDGVRQAKTWPSTGSQLGFSGIWSNTGIWFHDRRHEHYCQRIYSGPPSSPATTRRQSANTPQRAGEDATEGGDGRPGVTRRHPFTRSCPPAPHTGTPAANDAIRGAQALVHMAAFVAGNDAPLNAERVAARWRNATKVAMRRPAVKRAFSVRAPASGTVAPASVPHLFRQVLLEPTRSRMPSRIRNHLRRRQRRAAHRRSRRDARAERSGRWR